MKRRELYWVQNSRISWLKDGDRNTRFFHTVATNKRRKNSIASIEVNGKEFDDPNVIKREATSFFKKISKRTIITDQPLKVSTSNSYHAIKHPHLYCLSQTRKLMR